MLHAHILIISDHSQHAQTWQPGLSQLGVQVEVTTSDLTQFDKDLSLYQVIVLDAYTPDFDVTACCRTLRKQFNKVVLALTYERDERRQLLLYAAGVDEVVVKPLGVPLLQVKVAAWLRRATQTPQPGKPLKTPHFELELKQKRLVDAKGRIIRLSTLECNLLALLMSNQGQVLETDLLIDRVWPDYTLGDKELLKNLIYRLRRKIEPDPAAPRYIQTVSGQGYRFHALC